MEDVDYYIVRELFSRNPAVRNGLQSGEIARCIVPRRWLAPWENDHFVLDIWWFLGLELVWKQENM